MRLTPRHLWDTSKGVMQLHSILMVMTLQEIMIFQKVQLD